MKTISISLYNRPEYTTILLEHLNKCFGIEDYDITICCEPGTKSVENLAREFRPNQTNVIVNNKKLGCNANIYQCLAIGFSKSDYHIHFEDDIIPGKDCLKYFEWANNEYKNDESVFTVSAYVNSNCNKRSPHFFPINNNINLVSKRNWFTPWGWATWKDRFKEIQEAWEKNGGWDKSVNHIARKKRKEIFPHIARCQNIGAKLGMHVPNPEWHKENQLNSYWIESLDLYNNSEFKEVKPRFGICHWFRNFI